CSRINAREFFFFWVHFAPLSTPANTAILPYTALFRSEISLLGTNGAVSGPGVAFSPASVAFGSVVVGSTSATSNVQLTNSGTSTLDITSISLPGTDATQFALFAPTSGQPACSFPTTHI